MFNEFHRTILRERRENNLIKATLRFVLSAVYKKLKICILLIAALCRYILKRITSPKVVLKSLSLTGQICLLFD